MLVYNLFPMLILIESRLDRQTNLKTKSHVLCERLEVVE